MAEIYRNYRITCWATKGKQMVRTIISEIADKIDLEQDTVRDVVAEFALQLHRHALEYCSRNGDFIGDILWYHVGDQAFYHLLGFLDYFADRYGWERGSATEYLQRLGSRDDWASFQHQMNNWRFAESHGMVSIAHPGIHATSHDEDINCKDKIIREIAQDRCRKISSRIVRKLQRIKEGMQSGCDTPLRNLWDEICVQVQGEESIMWDTYLDTIRPLIEYEVKKVDTPTKQIIWLQAEEYNDLEGDNDNQKTPVFNDEDIVKYILHSFVLPAADNWTNKRIEKYLEREFD
jgi:hypothetical protein